MAPPGGVKKERGIASPVQARRAYQPSISETTYVSGGNRKARSGAPSVETRNVARSEVNGHEDNDSYPILREIRTVKVDETSSSGSASQDSFMGPNRALNGFGRELKEINDALGELQLLGVQHVADLPELVLVGDQSSGKSSLMSAIAGLALPRSSGTCTRCPIHIRVSRAAEWSCRVYLNKDYQYVPRDHQITKEDVTKSDPFPPWKKLESGFMERFEFKTVRDRFDSDEIENVIRCAQVAILHPTTPHEVFVPKLKSEGFTEDQRMAHRKKMADMERNPVAQFSPNTVALEVKGPDLADLNFYDLPGVFMSAKKDEDTFLECVVRNLTCAYVARPNAIILWAVPMNQDADNSYAFSLIRETKAVNRCVGVCTKADLLPERSSSSWLALLSGEAHQTGHNYYITSRQGDDLENQNAREEAFFNRTADGIGCWPKEFDQFKDRCGVEKLKAFLSRQLGEQFAKVLPEVQAKVEARIEEIEGKLKFYPNPPKNAELEIMRSLAEFGRDVKDCVQHQAFQSCWDAKYLEEFKAKILKLKPVFNVREPQRANDGPSTLPSTPARNPIVIDLIDSPPPTNRKRLAPEPSTPIKRQRTPNGTPSSVKTEGSNYPSIYMMTPSRVRPGQSKSLLNIRDMIKQNATPGQPGLVSPEVYHPLYTEAAKTWGPHLNSFVDQTLDFLQQNIIAALNRSFAHLQNTVVYRQSTEHMKAFIDSMRNELRTQLIFLYNLETKRLFTKDDESLNRNKAKEKRVLVRHRHYFRWAAQNGEEAPRVPKMEELTEDALAQEAARMSKEATRMLPDPFEQEIEVAAYVRGYYLTAANRFVDNVAIHVMSGLFPRVADGIDDYLYDKLKLSDRSERNDNLFNELISEQPEVERIRNNLHKEKEALAKGLGIITKLKRNDGDTKMADMPAPPRFTYVSPSISDDQQSRLGGFSTNYGDA